jgi:rod shape-determining protein MreB
VIRSLLSSLFLAKPLYVQIWKDRLRVRMPGNPKSFDDRPIVGLTEKDGRKTVSAIGAIAESTPCRRVYPFGHPRVIVHEFLVAEKLMKYAFHHVLSGPLIALSPIAVVQVMSAPEGGLTDIENRALLEVCTVAGAREVHMWHGRELTDAELLCGLYRSDA